MFVEKIKSSSSGARVLLITSNFLNSRCCQDQNGYEMYQVVKRTWGTCIEFVSKLLIMNKVGSNNATLWVVNVEVVAKHYPTLLDETDSSHEKPFVKLPTACSG